MADEAVLSVPGFPTLSYTARQYLTFASALQEKAKQLSSLGTSVQYILQLSSLGTSVQ